MKLKSEIPVKEILFLFGGVNGQVALIAGAFALGADAGRARQLQMDDAPLAGRHGIEPERLVRFPHARRRDARRKFQFFQSQRAIIARIEADVIVKTQFEPQPAHRQMFERKQLFVSSDQLIRWCCIDLLSSQR